MCPSSLGTGDVGSYFSRQVDVKAFVAANVHCLRPEFILSFLLDEPVPDLRDYYISQIHS